MTRVGRSPTESLTASAGGRDIPATSFSVPPRRPTLIDRDRLVKRVLEPAASSRELGAPPGCGRWTARLLCAEGDRRPYAWGQVSEADNGPVHLGRHIALALDRVSPLDREDVALIVGAGRSPGRDIFPTLVRVLAERSPCTVVLDDVHLLTSDGVGAGLQVLLSSV